MNKLGIQCQQRHEDVYRYNHQLRPVVIKSINILDREHYTKLAAENPGVQLVYRQVPNRSWDNEGDGRRWAEHLYNLVGHIPEITTVEGHNEWIHSPPHNSPEDFEKADRFMVEFIDRVHELWQGSVHAIVLNASCGHFNEDIVYFFPLTLARLQSCEKCFLGLHEYDHPNADMLGDGGHNLCGKFLRNLDGLKRAGYDKVRLAITECGVDSGVGAPAELGHVGFKYWGVNAATRYLDERNLGWYIPLMQETEGVAWATLFGLGMGGDWGSFDIKGTPVVGGIGEIYRNWVPPEDPPEPPNGGNDVIKVVDMDYNEQSEQWAKDKYGINWDFAPVSDGWVWRLIELWEKTGTTSHVSQVLDEDEQPVPNKIVTFYWSGAPISDIANELDWHSNYVYGPTNVSGDVGPGMGIGAYHGPGEGGPHEVWVHDDYIKSDRLKKIGMLAGTFHDHLDCKFKLMYVSEQPPQPPEDGVLDRILAVVEATKADATEILRILGTTPPPPDPEPPPPEKKTFTVQYFNSVDLSGPVIHEMEEPLIQGNPFFWHNWFAQSPAPGVNANHFSGRWTGVFDFEGREYTFNVRVDDGARLYVDDVLILDVWKDQSATTYSKSILLAAGKHKVVVAYYEKAGDAILHVNWA